MAKGRADGWEGLETALLHWVWSSQGQGRQKADTGTTFL